MKLPWAQRKISPARAYETLVGARNKARKHAADPQWAEVEDLVARPLRTLQRKVSDELIRRAAEKSEIVPIDRDPVPSEFSRNVREYYENLGIGL